MEWALGPGPSGEPKAPNLEIRSLRKKEIAFLVTDLDKNLSDIKRDLGLLGNLRGPLEINL